jgi:hypothetical protein
MEIGTLEYNHEDFIKERAGDEKLAIRFFRKAKQDSEESQKQGRPIFTEVDYIQIVVPGDRTSAIVRPVTQGDIARFERQYDHWKKTQQEELLAGTPLEAWGMMSLAQIEEYRYFGIRTIEHMSDLRDDVCQKIMGSTSLKQRATAFLQLAKEEAPMKAVQVALAQRDNELDTLKAAVADQAKIIEKLQAQLKKAA